MKPLPAWVLKAGVTAVTMLFAVFTAHYVSGHVKSSSAPLKPTVLQVSAGVRTADVQPVTTTYAS
jgi:hypothetical protein